MPDKAQDEDGSLPSHRASAAEPVVTWKIFSISKGVSLNWLFRQMQLVPDSEVLKSDPYKSQSFNHFHVFSLLDRLRDLQRLNKTFILVSSPNVISDLPISQTSNEKT